ncbi:MAG: energy-coupling factor transporter transmembrane component T [Planctomycetota bacterium]
MSEAFYVPVRTRIHRLHPVSKILCLVLWFVMAMIFAHPLYLGGLAVLAMLIAGRAGALRNLRRACKFMIVLFLLSAVLLALCGGGQTVWFRIGSLPIYYEAVLFGLGMGLRFDLMLLCGLIFLAATKVEDFTAGLNRLGVPYVVGFAFGLAFRLVPMFMESARTIVQAQRCRGLDLRSGGPFSRMRKYVPLIVPVFMSAVRRADNLAMALESKGFGAHTPRTSYAVYSFGAADAIAIVSCAILVMLCAALRIGGFGTV